MAKTEKQLLHKIKRLEAEVQHLRTISENYRVMYLKLRGKYKLDENKKQENKNEES